MWIELDRDLDAAHQGAHPAARQARGHQSAGDLGDALDHRPGLRRVAEIVQAQDLAQRRGTLPGIADRQVVEVEVGYQAPDRAMPQRRAQRGGRRGQALESLDRPAPFRELQPRLAATERQARRQIAIQTGRLDVGHLLAGDRRIQLQVDERQVDLATGIVGARRPARRMPVQLGPTVTVAESEQRLAGLPAIGRAQRDTVDRMDLEGLGPPRIRHDAVLEHRVIELDRLGALGIQVDDRRAAEREGVTTDHRLEIGQLGREVEIDIRPPAKVR